MKIISHGQLQEPINICTCDKCGCRFSFTKEEAKYHHDPRGDSAYSVKCPEGFCGKEIWIAPHLIK